MKNNTDYRVKVSLNPRSTAEGYKYELNLNSDRPEEGIYHIDLPDYDPRTLLSDGYASIIVDIDNPQKDRILFGINTDPNYELNPYKDLGSWEYSEYYFTYNTNYSSRKTLIYEFTFNISEELITE